MFQTIILFYFRHNFFHFFSFLFLDKKFGIFGFSRLDSTNFAIYIFGNFWPIFLYHKFEGGKKRFHTSWSLEMPIYSIIIIIIIIKEKK